jgi:hypothetical protein
MRFTFALVLTVLLASPVLAGNDLGFCHAFIYTDTPKDAEAFVAGLDKAISYRVIPITTTDTSAKWHWEVMTPTVVMTMYGHEVGRYPLITANPTTAKAASVAWVKPTPTPTPIPTPSEEAVLLRALAVKTGVSEAEILAAKTTLESEAAAKAAATPTPTPDPKATPAEEPIEGEGK